MRTLLVVFGVAFLLSLVPLLVRTLANYLKFRGKRVIRCPEVGGTAVIELDAPHAALTEPFGDAHMRVESCSLWPRQANCGKRCLQGLEVPGTVCVRC